MASRTRAALSRYGVTSGARFEWDLTSSRMLIGGTRFTLTTVGTMQGDVFRWAWADPTIPEAGKSGVEAVRSFGQEHRVPMLTEPTVEGGLPRANECLAAAGRVLDASAVLVDHTDSGHIFFVLHEPPS